MTIKQLLARLAPVRMARTAMAWAFLGTFLRNGLGVLLLVPLMVRYVPSEHLALWYVFVAMRAVVDLLDVGFVSSISRGIAHLSAGVEELQDFGIAAVKSPETLDDFCSHDRIGTFIATLRVYYRFFAAMCFVLLAVGGSIWIWHIAGSLPDYRMLQKAWLFYAGGYCVSMTGALWPSLLIGVNHVRKVEQIMIVGSMLNCLIAAVGIVAGYGIWALAAGAVAMAVVNRFAARSVFLSTVPSACCAGLGNRCDWRMMRALWPTSWRTGLGALGGYLTLSSGPILCSAFVDLKTTASFGLTMQLLTKLVTASALWIRVKIPLLNRFRAKGQMVKLAETFAGRVRLSLAMYIVGALGIILVGEPLMQLIDAQTPLLPVGMLAALLVARLLQLHQVHYALLILTENQNPFWGRLFITGVLVLLTSMFLLPVLHLWGILLPMLLIPAAYSHWSIVLRGVKGLGLPPWHYSRIILGMRVPE